MILGNDDGWRRFRKHIIWRWQTDVLRLVRLSTNAKRIYIPVFVRPFYLLDYRSLLPTLGIPPPISYRGDTYHQAYRARGGRQVSVYPRPSVLGISLPIQRLLLFQYVRQ